MKQLINWQNRAPNRSKLTRRDSTYEEEKTPFINSIGNQKEIQDDIHIHMITQVIIVRFKAGHNKEEEQSTEYLLQINMPVPIELQ